MAERSQYQYQPVTGPVWREPVAAALAWLPRIQQPRRGLQQAGIAPFVQPPFEALYKPETLGWMPSGRQPARAILVAVLAAFAAPQFETLYKPEGLQWLPSGRAPQRSLERAGPSSFAAPPFEALYKPEQQGWFGQVIRPLRVLARSALDYTVAPIQPPAAASYDPVDLAWQTRGIAPQVPVERRIVGPFAQAPFEALYRPSDLGWLPRPAWPLPPETRRLGDFQQPAFDAIYKPAGLDWEARGRAPQVPVERRILGDFARPIFEALYRPAGLEWISSERQPARGLPRGGVDYTVAAPVFFAVAAYDPSKIEWVPSGMAPQLILKSPLVAQLWAFCAPSFNGLPDVIPPIVVPANSGGWWPGYEHQRRRKRINAAEEIEAILHGEVSHETPEEIQARVEVSAARLKQKVILRKAEARSQFVDAEIKRLLDERFGLETAIAQLEIQDDETALMMILALAG